MLQFNLNTRTMKKIVYLFLLLLTGIMSAQNIVFNGTAFKNKLLLASASNNIAKDQNGINIKIDTNLDNEISYAEAAVVYELELESASINNLEGLAYFTNLTDLDFHQNMVSSVDLSSLTNLRHLTANHNYLTTIDISALTYLLSTDVSDNQLITIYAKNGNNADTINFNGSSNNGLSYICIDESQVSYINSILGSFTPIVNSFCTAPPGGNYTTLSGVVVFDVLSDGIDAGDPRFPFIKVQCVIGSNVLQTTTDANGQYVFYTIQTSGSFSIVPVIEDNSIFNVPTAYVGALGTNVIHDFVLTPIASPSPDLEVVVNPVSDAISGTAADYQVTYKNKGSKKVTGTVVFTYDAANMTVVSCTNPNASLATLGQVSLDFSDLLPFETRSYQVTFGISSSYPNGNLLNFNATITDILGATETTTVGDNTFNYKQTVGATIANTLTCLEGNVEEASHIGDYLHYDLHFVNNGNAVATNVVVKTVFDPTKYDLNSLQVLNSSHPLEVRVKDTEALFYLSNVAIGGPGGDGGILLKIASNSNLTAGQSVSTNAEIFFDYGTNFNIGLLPNSTATTAIETTTFQNLSLTQNRIDASVSIYPNPAQSLVSISATNTIKSVQLFDVFGRLLQMNVTDAITASLDISERLNGVYFLKITTDYGSKVIKILKE